LLRLQLFQWVEITAYSDFGGAVLWLSKDFNITHDYHPFGLVGNSGAVGKVGAGGVLDCGGAYG